MKLIHLYNKSLARDTKQEQVYTFIYLCICFEVTRRASTGFRFAFLMMAFVAN